MGIDVKIPAKPSQAPQGSQIVITKVLRLLEFKQLLDKPSYLSGVLDDPGPTDIILGNLLKWDIVFLEYFPCGNLVLNGGTKRWRICELVQLRLSFHISRSVQSCKL